ncbi:MAG: hypothetical protein ACYDCA_10400 [Candidatus Tyrphobacter sp.]
MATRQEAVSFETSARLLDAVDFGEGTALQLQNFVEPARCLLEECGVDKCHRQIVGRFFANAAASRAEASQNMELVILRFEEESRARNVRYSDLRHEIGNSLSIAQANIEGFIDHCVEPTEQRFRNILSSLQTIAL